jgi:hypothetical protein
MGVVWKQPKPPFFFKRDQSWPAVCLILGMALERRFVGFSGTGEGQIAKHRGLLFDYRIR